MRLFGFYHIDRYDGLLYLGRTCDWKVQHGTARLATLAAYWMEERKPGERFDVYYCRWCLAWHVGHTRERLSV